MFLPSMDMIDFMQIAGSFSSALIRVLIQHHLEKEEEKMPQKPLP